MDAATTRSMTLCVVLCNHQVCFFDAVNLLSSLILVLAMTIILCLINKITLICHPARSRRIQLLNAILTTFIAYRAADICLIDRSVEFAAHALPLIPNGYCNCVQHGTEVVYCSAKDHDVITA